MSLDFYGIVELKDDITAMADALKDSGSGGGRAIHYILTASAQPILDRMVQNASSNPTPRSGALRNSIRVGRVVHTSGGGYKIQIGVFSGSEASGYSPYVELGHGGPHGPAAPHPFVRPAFDAGASAAYDIMKQNLREALTARA